MSEFWDNAEEAVVNAQSAVVIAATESQIKVEKLEAENRRLKVALENTKHNLKHSSPKAVCDGLCAKHECVCLPGENDESYQRALDHIKELEARIEKLEAALSNVRAWRDMSDDSLRLHMGELSAQACRDIKAAFKAALLKGET